VYADKLIRRSISYIESMKERKGENFLEVVQALQEMKFRSVNLRNNRRMITIRYEQFLRRLVNTIRARMLSSISNTIISELNVLEVDNWPSVIPPFYGRNEIRSLSERFQLNVSKAITAFQDYLDNGGKRLPKNLKPLLNCAKVTACSSSECERGFSRMNLLFSDIRSRLLIQNVTILMFIKLHGPRLTMWDPNDYINMAAIS